MFTLRDRRTGDLFDRWSDLGEKRRHLLERSWAGVFRDHLLSSLPVDELCRHFDQHMGRPSKDLACCPRGLAVTTAARPDGWADGRGPGLQYGLALWLGRTQRDR